VREFEATFAAFQDAKLGAAVTNGTAGLNLSLLAAGVDGVVAHFERNFGPMMPDGAALSDIDALLATA